jgi:hypothetical protein
LVGDISKSFFSEKYSFETNKEQDKTKMKQRLLISLKRIQMLFTQVQEQKKNCTKTKKILKIN